MSYVTKVVINMIKFIILFFLKVSSFLAHYSRFNDNDAQIRCQQYQSMCAEFSPFYKFGAPPAIGSGEAKICTASWENVDKQMPCNTKLHKSMFRMT